MTLSHLLSPNLPCILSYTSGVLHPVSHMMYSYTLSSTLSCILSCIYPHMPPYSHAFILSIYTSLGVHISADPLGFGLWGWKSQCHPPFHTFILTRLNPLLQHPLSIYTLNVHIIRCAYFIGPSGVWFVGVEESVAGGLG